MTRGRVILISLLLAIAAITAAALYRYYHPLTPATQPAVAATGLSPASTRLATKIKRQRGPATQLLDMARADDPKYPTTARLDETLDLKYAAHIPLKSPVYLDVGFYPNFGPQLWITRPDAPASFDFKKAAQSQTATQAIRDQVVFVYWGLNDASAATPHLVVRGHSADAPYELVDEEGRRPLPDPHGFNWSRATVLRGPGEGPRRDRIVVPTRSGVAAFAFDQTPEEIAASHQKLIDPKPGQNPDDFAVQLIMDVSGVIAWVTNAAGTKGAHGIARLAPLPADPQNPNADAPREFKWTLLTGKPGWPDGILHLRPLLDGTVIQIISLDGEKVTFSANTVQQVTIDEKQVVRLILQLSDADVEKRDLAYKLLTNYGPAITPMLERSLELLDPEAKIRVRQLIAEQTKPGLGSMSLVDGKMKVAARFPDGGVLFFSEAGVAIPRGEPTPAYVTPAWLAIRPGQYVHLLADTLTADFRPGQQSILAWANEYLVMDDLFGPQRFIGNRLEPLLRKSERHHKQFVGIDSVGRWIFRAPAPPSRESPTKSPATTHVATTHATTTSSTAATTTSTTDYGLRTTDSYLILDPRLPDTTPRLPGWQLPPSAGAVGWDKDGWPVIHQDTRPKPTPWALMESNWRALDPNKEKVSTNPNELPKPVPPPRAATTTSTTNPATATATTTSASTAPASQDAALRTQDLLLVAPDKTAYYGGKDSLHVIRPDGTTIHWPLPNQAIGTAEKPTLLRTRDNLLFLFNEPGRIVRIRPNVDPESGEFRQVEPPFEVEAVFTRKVPTDPSPLRIWLDPADRICIAHDGKNITVLFPLGRIPPAIATLMPVDQIPADEE
jgi:hypothetical protein